MHCLHMVCPKPHQIWSHLKSKMVLSLSFWLTQVTLEKRPLNGVLMTVCLACHSGMNVTFSAFFHRKMVTNSVQ